MEERMQKEMFLFSSGGIVYFHGPDVWFILNKLNVRHFKHLYSHKNKK